MPRPQALMSPADSTSEPLEAMRKIGRQRILDLSMTDSWDIGNSVA
jgi:hypothetical protein